MSSRPIGFRPRLAAPSARVGWGLTWLAYAACAALLLAPPLFGAPLLGVADNGDGWRVLEPAGLAPVEAAEAHHARFVQPRYRLTEPRKDGQSSTSVLAWVARLPSAALGAPFDIRQLALAHLLLLGLGLALAQRRGVAWSFALVSLAVFADPEYVLHLNSPLPAASALVAVLSTTWWAMARRPLEREPPGRRFAASALVLFGALGGFAKQSQVLLPMLSSFAVPPQATGRARAALIGALLLVGLAAALHYSVGSGHRFPEINDYHTVYRGIATATREPDRVLRDLRLPPSTRSLIGRSWFDAQPSAELEAALARVSRLQIAWLYVKEPAAAAAMVERIHGILSDPRPLWLGSFSHRPGGPTGSWDPAARFRRIRAASLRMPALPLTLIAWIAAAVFVVRRGSPSVRWTQLYLAGVFFAGCAVAVLGDGSFSLRRHLLVPSLALDLWLGLLAWVAATRLVSYARRREVDQAGSAASSSSFNSSARSPRSSTTTR